MSTPVGRWLQTFMCQKYADIFENYGYKTLQSVCRLEVKNLQSMGVVPEDCDKIMENIKVLRQSLSGQNSGDQVAFPDPLTSPASSALMSISRKAHRGYGGSSVSSPPGPSSATEHYNPAMPYNAVPSSPPFEYSRFPRPEASCGYSPVQWSQQDYYNQSCYMNQQGFGNREGWPSRPELRPSTAGASMRPRAPPNFRNYTVTQNPQQVANDIVNMACHRYSHPRPPSVASVGSPPPPNMRRYRLGSPPADRPVGFHGNQYCSGDSTSPVSPPMSLASPSSTYSAGSSLYGTVQGAYPRVGPVSSPVVSAMNSPPSRYGVAGMQQEVAPHIPSISEDQETDVPLNGGRREQSPGITPSSYSMPQRPPCSLAYSSPKHSSSKIDCNESGNIAASAHRSSQRRENNPLQSLHKLAMFTNSQVIDPKSVVHDACFSGGSVMDGSGKVEGVYEDTEQKNYVSGSSVENMAGLSLIGRSSVHVPPPYVHQGPHLQPQFTTDQIPNSIADFVSFSPCKLATEPVINPSELDLDMKIPPIDWEVHSDSDPAVDSLIPGKDCGKVELKETDTLAENLSPEKTTFADDGSNTSTSDIRGDNPLISELLSDDAPSTGNKMKSPDVSPLKRESITPSEIQLKKTKLSEQGVDTLDTQISTSVDSKLDHQNNNPPKANQGENVAEVTAVTTDCVKSTGSAASQDQDATTAESSPNAKSETEAEKNKLLLQMRRRRRVRNFVTPKESVSVATGDKGSTGGFTPANDVHRNSKHCQGSPRVSNGSAVSSSSSQVNKAAMSSDSQLTNLNCLKGRNCSNPRFEPRLRSGFNDEVSTGRMSHISLHQSVCDSRKNSGNKSVLGGRGNSGVGNLQQGVNIHRHVESCQENCSDVDITGLSEIHLPDRGHLGSKNKLIQGSQASEIFEQSVALLDVDGFSMFSISIGLPDVNGNVILTNANTRPRKKSEVTGLPISMSGERYKKQRVHSILKPKENLPSQPRESLKSKLKKKSALMRKYLASFSRQCTHGFHDLMLAELHVKESDSDNKTQKKTPKGHDTLSRLFITDFNMNVPKYSNVSDIEKENVLVPAAKGLSHKTSYFSSKKISRNYLQRELEKLIEFKESDFERHLPFLSKPKSNFFDLEENGKVAGGKNNKWVMYMCELYQGFVGMLSEVIAMPVIEVDVSTIKEDAASLLAANTTQCLEKQPGEMEKTMRSSASEDMGNGQLKLLDEQSVAINGTDDTFDGTEPEASGVNDGGGGECLAESQKMENVDPSEENDESLAYTVTINDSGSDAESDNSKLTKHLQFNEDGEYSMANIKMKSQMVEIPLEIVSIIKRDEVISPASLMNMSNVKTEIAENLNNTGDHESSLGEQKPKVGGSPKNTPKDKKRGKKRKRKSEPWEEESENEESFKMLNLSRTFDLFKSGKIKKPKLDLSKEKGKKKGKSKIKEKKSKEVVVKPLGPIVKIKGSKETPTFSTIVNMCDVDLDGKGRQSRDDRSFIGNQGAFDLDDSVPFLCAICGNPSSYEGLGDLFGPYYAQDNQPHSSRRGKTTSSQDNQPQCSRKGKNTFLQDNQPQCSKQTKTVSLASGETVMKKMKSTPKGRAQKIKVLEVNKKGTEKSKGKKLSGAKKEEFIMIDLTDSDVKTNSRKSNSQSTKNDSPTAVKGKRKSRKEQLGESKEIKEIWVHEDCLIWTSGVYVVGYRVYGIEEAVKVSQLTSCNVCKKVGATLGCFSKNCGQKFHYICAKETGCYLDEENFSVFCVKHKGKKVEDKKSRKS